MQVSTKLLLVSGAVAIFTAGAVAAGCSDDPEKPRSDSGADVVTPPTDSPVSTDSPADSPPVDAPPDAPAVVRAKVLAVHAAHGLPAIRFCFATGQKDDGSDGSISPLPPLPNDDTESKAAGLPYPAIFAGTGGSLPDLQTDLSLAAITPYFVDAASVKDHVRSNPKSLACDELLGKGDGGIPTSKFWKLPTIPKGTLAHDKTILLAGTGCPADYAGQYDTPGATAQVIGANCGGAPGNLKVEIFVLDNAPGTDPAKFGLQFIQLSPGTAAIATSIGGRVIGQTFVASDGGFTPSTLADPATYAVVTPTKAAQVAAPNLAGDGIGGSVLTADGGVFVNGVPVTIVQTWGQTYALTTGDKTGAGIATYYAPGKNYTGILVGVLGASTYINPLDGGPTTADGGGIFNGKSIHALVFPSDPAIKKFNP